MGKKLVGALIALVLSTGLTAPVHASPLLQGTTSASVFSDTLYPGCSGYCAAFFSAGCPDSMIEADGVTTSIVDVSNLGGRTLTFTWSSSSVDLYDRLHPSTGDSTPQLGRMFFYVADACVQPDWFALALESLPNARTRTYTIPAGSKWLIAQAAETTIDNVWSASNG